MEFDGQKMEELYDRVLVAVGRVPNSANLGLENTKVTLMKKGSSKSTTGSRRTTRTFMPSATSPAASCSHTRRPRRHDRRREYPRRGQVFESIIPAVVFTDPELAWCGLTETEAKEKGVKYRGFQISLVGFRPRFVLRPGGRYDQIDD